MSKFIAISAVVMIVLMISGVLLQSVYHAQASTRLIDTSTGERRPLMNTVEPLDFRKAPLAITGENVYVAWWTNETGNDEVIFRASNDNGQTFADKINLSNSTEADSQDVEIAADGDNVIITWWERNQTSEEPVVKISADNGQTFGPLLRLAANGTIGQAAAEQ